MIITRTPLRMSFVGGGSDLPAYYEKFGGAVISTAIDKYVFVTVNKKFDDALRISYSKTELVKSVSEIEHTIVRAALTHVGITGGLEITSIADIPSSGSGLGSSSSFTVGLLHALYAYLGKYVAPDRLGDESCHIEIDTCGSPIGKQDQFAAAFGGFNFIRFHCDGTVVVNPLICSRATLRKLQNNLIMFYTATTRSANNILSEQSKQCSSSEQAQRTMHRMVQQTAEFAQSLQNDDCDAIGEILHEGWMLKRSLNSGISNDHIDDWYNRARAAGAIGGKILGAGAGGFFLFYAPQERHDALIHALPQLRHIPFAFEPEGSKVIFYC